MLIHRKLKSCLNQLASCGLDTGLRHGAERQLGKLVLQLVDGKIRHGLSHSEELHQLCSAVLDSSLDLPGSAGILLDHFRYRLAHVAMRSGDWNAALKLLTPVVEGQTTLRLARIYQALCTGKLRGRCLDSGELQELVRDLVSAETPDGRGPLDLAVQDPVTNMAEIFLLLQGAPEHVIDGLYDAGQEDSFARGLTSGLELLLVESEGEHSSLEAGDWLAIRQLRELQADGWLVVDTTVPLGELGRGSPAKPRKGEPNQRELCGLLQVLGQAAPTPLDLATLRARFFKQAGPDLIEKPGRNKDRGPKSDNPVPIERATKAWLGTPKRPVIDNTDRRWTLVPPYAVIKSDARKTLAHSLPSPQ